MSTTKHILIAMAAATLATAAAAQTSGNSGPVSGAKAAPGDVATGAQTEARAQNRSGMTTESQRPAQKPKSGKMSHGTTGSHKATTGTSKVR